MIDGDAAKQGISLKSIKRKTKRRFSFSLFSSSSVRPTTNVHPSLSLLSVAQVGCSVESLHDDSGLWDGLADGFVRQDVGAVQIKFIVHDHILPQHRHVLHTDLLTHMNTERSRHDTFCCDFTPDNSHKFSRRSLGAAVEYDLCTEKVGFFYSPTGQQSSSTQRCSSPARSGIELWLPSSPCSVLSSPRLPRPRRRRWSRSGRWCSSPRSEPSDPTDESKHVRLV